jgi:hypothetical protein
MRRFYMLPIIFVSCVLLALTVAAYYSAREDIELEYQKFQIKT